MNRVFTAGEGFTVPDGTIVHSVLDAGSLSQGAGEWVEGVSIALGHIPPHTTSKIHLHPAVTQVTWVVSGQLTVVMKDPASDAPYMLDLTSEQAAMTLPGTFFQLVNGGAADCRVLYIVAPAFLFEAGEGGEVLYNDALVFDADWGDLADAGWAVPELDDLEAIHAARRASRQRLQRKLALQGS